MVIKQNCNKAIGFLLGATFCVIVGCEKDSALKGDWDNKGDQTQPNVMTFMDESSKGNFGFEWDGLVCGKGDLVFKGYMYDATGGKPVSNGGKLWLGNDTIAQGGKDVNYVYGEPGNRLNQPQFINKGKKLSLKTLQAM